MNSYQKKGIFIFRLCGIILIFAGLVGLFYFMATHPSSGAAERIILGLIVFGVIFSLPGIAVILLSKKFGMFTGKDLDD